MLPRQFLNETRTTCLVSVKLLLGLPHGLTRSGVTMRGAAIHDVLVVRAHVRVRPVGLRRPAAERCKTQRRRGRSGGGGWNHARGEAGGTGRSNVARRVFRKA